MRRIAVALIAAVLSVGLVAPVAGASDASLARTVNAWARRSRAPLNAWSKAVDRFSRSESRADARRLQTATRRYLAVVDPYRRAVAGEDASSDEHAAAQRRLVKALGLFASGLRAYDRGLGQWLSGEGEAKAKRSLEAAKRKFDSANRTITNEVRVLTDV